MRSYRPGGNSFRRNPGHSPLRQQLAPQPDARGAGPASLRAGQGRPLDRYRQAGGQPGQAAGALKPGYGSFLDQMNPNKDSPLPGGLNDKQVMWLKQHLLGRTGAVTGREGAKFQGQIGNYIKQSGGMNPFMQMLGGMPGWGRKAAAPGVQRANTFDPTQGRQGRPGRGQGPFQGPNVGPIKNGPLGTNQPPPMTQPGYGPRTSQPPGRPQPPNARTMQQATGQMFPQQAQQFGGQQQFQSSVQGGGGGTGQPSPSSPVPPSTQGRGGQPAGAPQQVRPRASSPQETGQALARDPAVRASAIAYRGETDPERQKAQDREFFGKRGVPLTPEVEEGMRALTDEFIQTMIQIGYNEADAAAYVNMTKERLASDHGQDVSDINEAAANNGQFSSGLRLQQQADTSKQYGRSYQDLAMQSAQQQRAIADAKASSIEALRQGRQELAMNATRQAVGEAAAGNNYTGLRTGRRKTRRRGNR